MIHHRRAKVCLVAVTIIAATGAIDAAFGRVWDLAVLLAAIAVLAAIALVPSGSDRSPIALRRDLAHWLQHRSAVESESVDHLADRAVATYRSQWLPHDDAGA
ncbi:MAG: hypothetical protein AAFP84_05135 [Actinomycetota bacterium]